MLYNTDISVSADPNRVQMSHSANMDILVTWVITLHILGREQFVFVHGGEGWGGGVWGRSKQRKGRETWLVSHQARPVHQGDRRDCRLHSFKPETPCLVCWTLSASWQQALVCVCACKSVCLCVCVCVCVEKIKDVIFRFILFNRRISPPFNPDARSLFLSWIYAARVWYEHGWVYGRESACARQVSCRHYVCWSTRLLVLYLFVTIFFFFSLPAVSFSTENVEKRTTVTLTVHHYYLKNSPTEYPLFQHAHTHTHTHTHTRHIE